MSSHTDKIGLGTVQFGTEYGITNSAGMTPPEEVRNILETAGQAGILTLDTAHLYGQSESVLGQTIPPKHPFQIVTKTPDFDRLALKNADDAVNALKTVFQKSLDNLKRDSVYALLVHNAGGLLGPHKAEIYKGLQDLKASGKVQKIGASVYEAAQIDFILEHCGPIDLVQVPVNVFDQRLIKNGYLRKLKDAGIEIHARSLFLQGALLAPADQIPPRLRHFSAYFEAYHQLLENYGLDPLAACLNFGLSIPEIDRLIIGVTTEAQLAEIMGIVHRAGLMKFDFSALSCDDETFINPAKWPKVAT